MIEKKNRRNKTIIFLAEVIVGVALYMLVVKFLWPLIAG